MNEQKLHKISELSSTAWKWFKAKDSTDVAERDDYYWETVTKDIRDMVKKCDKDLREFYTNLLNTFSGQLQKDYVDYLGTKQGKLPL